MTGLVNPSLLKPGYLQHRPSERCAPPTDPRMYKARRWTTWVLREVEGKPKPNKVPQADPVKPDTWSYFYTVRAKLHDHRVAGIGFEMYGESGLVGIDLDKCISAVGVRSRLLKDLLAILEKNKTKCHVEVTPSGTGVRIFAGETKGIPFHDFLNNEHGVEFYTGESGRYLTYTGLRLVEWSEIEGDYDPLPEEAVVWLSQYAKRWKDGRDVDPVKTAERPNLSQRDDWPNLYPGALKKIGPMHVKYLKTGEVGGKYASASEHLFAVEQALLKYLKIEQAYQILISAPGSFNVAMEHRENSGEKAKTFLWDDLNRVAALRATNEKQAEAEATGWRECGIEVEQTNDGARAKLIRLNMVRAFEKHADCRDLEWDDFLARPTFKRVPVDARKEIELGAWVMEFLKWPAEPRAQEVREAISEAAKVRRYNPVETHLRGYVWDGKDRLDLLVAAVCESPSALDREIWRRWLIGYVARGLSPGCKMDNMLCLRGPEGAKKTSLARVFAVLPEWFDEATKFSDDSETVRRRVGKRVLEVGEGIAARRSDKNDLKIDLSKVHDDFRPLWVQYPIRSPRQFVYILTANPKRFLRADQDGLRRIWPVDVKPKIDLGWVEKHLDQLLAQAVTEYDRGEAWWFDDENAAPELLEALKARASGAVAEDPLDSVIESFLESDEAQKHTRVNFKDLCGLIEMSWGRGLTPPERARVSELLPKHGFRYGTFDLGVVNGKRKQFRGWLIPHPNDTAPESKVVALNPSAGEQIEETG